ncbi:MAG: hypothetical protein HYX67_13720 [Candidatus Melainabacteria bacterium]|nr:hypothetical protein [Candidatus Melainabacteria bacterium]
MAKFSTDEFQPLEYQAWYTRARRLVALLIPERLKDFEQLYKTDHKIKDLIARYSIEDYLNGMRVPAMVGDSKMLTANRFEQQYAILWSAASQIDPILDKVTAVIKDEVLADELTSARYLAKGNHLRAAGAVAGPATVAVSNLPR